jgi:hypothetical protein
MRKKKLKTKFWKVFECMALTFVTVTVFYFTPYFAKNYCSPISSNWSEEVISKVVRYDC